jgi:hypothetical protein
MPEALRRVVARAARSHGGEDCLAELDALIAEVVRGT